MRQRIMFNNYQIEKNNPCHVKFFLVHCVSTPHTLFNMNNISFEKREEMKLNFGAFFQRFGNFGLRHAPVIEESIPRG